MPTSGVVSSLDDRIRNLIREKISDGVTVDDVAFLLTRMLPELGDRRWAHGHVEAAFDLFHAHHPEIDRSLPNTVH